MEKIVTLCLFPFENGSRWVICETEVTSIVEIEDVGADACVTNTTLETHSAESKEHAYWRAKLVAIETRLPLYLLTVHEDSEHELARIDDLNAHSLSSLLTAGSLSIATETHRTSYNGESPEVDRSYLQIIGTPDSFRYIAALLLELARNADASVILDPAELPYLTLSEWSALDIACRAADFSESHLRESCLE